VGGVEIGMMDLNYIARDREIRRLGDWVKIATVIERE
jgi:hypothetical protein